MKKLIKIAIFAIIIGLGILVIYKLNNLEEKGDSLERITKKGTFILGLDDSFPPMGYRNDDNEIVGFDIDVAREVSKRLNVELILKPISWTAKETELNTYNIDCIWNGLSIDSKREKSMSLSYPYLENKMVFVVKDKSINKIEELKGKKVGVQSGSTAETILNDYNNKTFKNIITYSDNIVAFMDLEINQTSAVFMDSVVANYYIKSTNKNYKVLEESLETEQYAIGFRKQDTSLRDKVNEILIEMKNDKSLGKISEKWFGKDVTIIKEK